ncbi:hypothetical protein [Piscinibacter sp.]|uniref:hypothetical protein n=2 Tax=Piscinibacter sp. TaxID=1903157 RepID=UPI0025F78E13|nr:hypothetical protein [Piscinibacter sp.]
MRAVAMSRLDPGQRMPCSPAPKRVFVLYLLYLLVVYVILPGVGIILGIGLATLGCVAAAGRHALAARAAAPIARLTGSRGLGEPARAIRVGGVMWLLVAREPRPDAPDWPGRRLLAAIDAVAWPLMWVLLIRQVPGPAGLVGPFVTALAVLLGLGRLHRVLWINHRYWFTTWRWGKVLGAMLLIGAVLKIAMSA